MKDIDLEAFRPVPFPERGPDETFNANFCRNPMCPNFGPAPDLDASAERYSVFRDSDVRTDRRYKRLVCESSSRLLSNRCREPPLPAPGGARAAQWGGVPAGKPAYRYQAGSTELCQRSRRRRMSATSSPPFSAQSVAGQKATSLQG